MNQIDLFIFAGSFNSFYSNITLQCLHYNTLTYTMLHIHVSLFKYKISIKKKTIHMF